MHTMSRHYILLQNQVFQSMCIFHYGLNINIISFPNKHSGLTNMANLSLKFRFVFLIQKLIHHYNLAYTSQINPWLKCFINFQSSVVRQI